MYKMASGTRAAKPPSLNSNTTGAEHCHHFSLTLFPACRGAAREPLDPGIHHQ